MLRTLLVLPDGTELFSGAPEGSAVQSVTITQMVNASQELTPGSACANMVEVKIITPAGDLAVTAGDEITVYRVDDASQRYKVGIFIAEKPTRNGANAMTLTAYDRVSRLDRDISDYLGGLTAWPYRLADLASMVCAECGLTLRPGSLPNGDYPVEKFTAQGITGRQVMQWIGQIACRFCRATAEGEIEFAWYTPNKTRVIAPGETALDPWAAEENQGNVTLKISDAAVTCDGLGAVDVTTQETALHHSDGDVQLSIAAQTSMVYYQDTLSFEDYTVAPIAKVQLRQNEQDVGTVYPDNPGAVNTYDITGNYLLTAATNQALKPVAQVIYEELKHISYTPCKVSVPAGMDIQAGDILRLYDRNGRRLTAYVMTKTQQGQRDTLECTGSATRQSSSAVNSQQYTSLAGKVLNLQTDVEGIRAENKDARDNAATLALQIDSIRTQVQSQQETAEGMQTLLTQLEQTAQEISVKVESSREEGASRVDTSFGVTIDGSAVWVHRSGSQMTTRLDETGLQVVRSAGSDYEETVLQADDAGVRAADVQVDNFLCIGENARFEDYTDGTDTHRTACFYIGG